MTLDQMRNKFQEIIKEENRSKASISRELNITQYTFDDFLSQKRNPRYETIVKMKEFLKNNGKD